MLSSKSSSYRVLFVIKISEIVETNLHHSSKAKFANFTKSAIVDESGKVMYPKYFKHWPYTVSHTIDFGAVKSLFKS